VQLKHIESIYSKGWWGLYYTNPGVPNFKKTNIENPEKALIRLIKNAKKSFYGAFYEISSKNIAMALLLAHKRGVNVKLITDSDNMDNNIVRLIYKKGIMVRDDARSGLMHNKFAVIDENIVWTGSYNLTNNGSNKNNNNAIEIHSKDLACIYNNEFFEMFKYRIFGNKKELGPFSSIRKKYYVKIGNTNINVYFSPEDNIERIILKKIKKASKSIHFMAFSFTSNKIGEMMIQKFKKGIEVYGIFEKIGAKSRHSEFIKMKIEGLPVRLDKNKNRMHHKVIIIDKRRVLTGSYNFSKSANKRNDENILMIDNKKIAKEYLKEFYRLY